MDRNGVYGKAVHLCLEVSGLETQREREFPGPSRPTPKLTQPPVRGVCVSSSGVKRPVRGVDYLLLAPKSSVGRAIPLPTFCACLACYGTAFALYTRGVDKSLARPGRKKVNVSLRMAWIFFGALPCRGKKS